MHWFGAIFARPHKSLFLSPNGTPVRSSTNSHSPFARDEWALVSTRGAANAKTLEELEIAPSADIYFFPQSDEAGKRWLESILVILGRAAFVVGTDKPHKDLGEWGLNLTD
jgi:hypothetical protein